ncbi:MAG: ABC transporter substrate-binding protein, partial [Spirochaetia bacterium]|nr:ABC transporter substrate-binding protein [Spirochaetia bacterium]
PALKNGQVWNNNLRMSPQGGNDYFESGFMKPQVVLADMMAILHPELMPAHEFVYYRKLK